jgi:hypothetical protein
VEVIVLKIEFEPFDPSLAVGPSASVPAPPAPTVIGKAVAVTEFLHYTKSCTVITGPVNVLPMNFKDETQKSPEVEIVPPVATIKVAA